MGSLEETPLAMKLLDNRLFMIKYDVVSYLNNGRPLLWQFFCYFSRLFLIRDRKYGKNRKTCFSVKKCVEYTNYFVLNLDNFLIQFSGNISIVVICFRVSIRHVCWYFNYQLMFAVSTRIIEFNTSTILNINSTWPVSILSCRLFMISFNNAQAPELIRVGPSLVVSSGQ